MRSLFEHAYPANFAILAVGGLIVFAFILSEQTKHIFLFSIILIFSLCARILTTFYANKNNDDQLIKYTRYYVFASLIVGLDLAFINIAYYDLNDHELRSFLTIISFGLITAAIGSLSVWLRAYLSFSVPQIIALISVFILNDGVYVALTVVIFSGFMIKIANNFNKKFKEGYVLIEKNTQLIEHMQLEIKTRKKSQVELENHQFKLEQIVKDRTIALENINENLNDQIGIRRVVEKQLEYLAYYDELTELPNRTLFIEELKRALPQAKRSNELLGVLFIDLDEFKKINDSYGHYIGDKLLKCVAERLKNCLRESDMLARNSGDEFVLFIENMEDASEPFVVANKLIDSFNEKFIIDEHIIHTGVSIGLAMFPLDGDEALDLIKNADTAMYEAKNIGKNNLQFYSSAMSNKITERLELENALRDALSKNEFFLVYQPQVDLNTKKTFGFEALIRWNSPEFGIVSPFKFIPVLEETGLIYSVGEWVILEVLQFIKSGASKNTKVSINLSALQCGIANYSSKIQEFISASGVDPKLIEFEITESLLISDFSQTENFLTDISNLGCTIALDDFGTGYTSFAYLTKLPIDVIKIDRSLITGIHSNKNLQDIVKAIVTMSASLGIKNVFEGVETEDELAMVEKLNGVVIQGYYFSKPLETSKIHEWFAS